MDDVLTEYERVTAEKISIEQEIALIVEELTSGGAAAPGLQGPLIDAEGYPRGDIDVYRVRHLRNAFAVKQNDHKAVMKRIETILPLVFEAKTAQAKAKAETATPRTDAAPQLSVAVLPATAAAAATTIVTGPAPVADLLTPPTTDAVDTAKKPFAVVESVQNDSPAEWAELQPGDHIVVFGTADATNHRHLEAVKEIVRHNVGSAIRVVVQRRSPREEEEGDDGHDSWTFHELRLTPQQWRGVGVLGCLLQPILEPADARRSP